MENIERPLRLGMVGGGIGGNIGSAHRYASRLDGHFSLVAGAMSSDPERAKQSAVQFGIADDRTYTNFKDMALVERDRPDGIEAVSIVTPNHLHFSPVKAFLEAGIHVICDKPLTATLAEAEQLAEITTESSALFILTHNYTGYPLIRQARAMVEAGELGDIRVIQVEYPQDWLATPLEQTGHKQAGWRTDPTRSGAGGCVADIGTHALNLANFVSGLEVEHLAADLGTFVEGRAVDDNVQVLLRYKQKGNVPAARGMLWASQVATGHENDLRLRIYGTKASIEWSQEHPNTLWLKPFGAAKRLITRAGAGASDVANALSRVPGGHPEGYLEGFANLYTEAARAIRAVQTGGTREAAMGLLPGIEAGLEGMRFIDACIRSSRKDAAWVSLSG